MNNCNTSPPVGFLKKIFLQTLRAIFYFIRFIKNSIRIADFGGNEVNGFVWESNPHTAAIDPRALTKTPCSLEKMVFLFIFEIQTKRKIEKLKSDLPVPTSS